MGEGNIFSLCVSSHLHWRGGGYLGWGEGVPTLDGGGGTYLGWGRGYLPWIGWEGGTYPLQVMPRAVCLLHSCSRTFLLVFVSVSDSVYAPSDNSAEFSEN